MAMANLMGNSAALLLKGHGSSVARSHCRAIMLEEAAKVQILAGLAGKVTPYAADELIGFKKIRRTKVRNDRPGGLFERVWEYYQFKL